MLLTNNIACLFSSPLVLLKFIFVGGVFFHSNLLLASAEQDSVAVERSALNLSVEEITWLKEHPVIQLGTESNWPPYEFVNQSGELQGITTDIIKILEKQLGIQLKINSQYSWEETLKKIRNHDIDIVSGISISPEREKYLIFTHSYLTPLIGIYTRKDDITINHFDDLKNKTVVVENQYFSHEELVEKHPEIKLLVVETTTDALKALSYGKADAYIGDQGATNWVIEKNALNNIKVIANSDPDQDIDSRSHRLAVRDDWVIFQIILNKALTSIAESEMSSIRRKWLGVEAGTKKIELSKTEQQWLNQHKTIRFTGDPNWLPYEAFDRQGNYIGIVADHLKLIEKKLGITVDIIPTRSWSESVAKVKRGEIDVLSETNDSDLISQLTFTESYVASPVVIVMRSEEGYVDNVNQIKKKKISVIKDYGYVPKIIKKYPNLNLIIVNDIQEGLTSVSTGQSDALLATLAQASYHISDLGINNIRIVGRTEFDTKLAFGMSAEFVPLVPLFNRAIDSISQNEKQEIFSFWGKQKFAARMDYSLLAKVAAIFLSLLAIIAYWNRRLNKEIIYRKEIEAQTQNLIDTIPLQIVITAFDGNIVYANPQALDHNNITKEQLKDFNMSDFYDDVNDRDMIVKELSTKGRVHQKIIPFKKPNGEVRSMMLSILPIKYNNAQVLLTIALDMTERLQLEEALQNSKDLAEEASRFKSQFLANMSHEIRTPMNAVIGMSHLALNTNLDDKQRDYVEKIKISGQNLLVVINDILDFSKIEAGKLEIENTEFLLDSMLENMLSMVAVQAEEKNIEIIFKRDVNITNTLIGDPLRINQILLNLVQNAIKFTERGSVIISVQLLNKEKNRQKLEFSVLDTGIGVEKEKLSKLFEAFIQVDSSTTRRHGGTGLGLSISQQLAHLMGGQLSAKSVIGEGSEFSFTLDLVVQKNVSPQTFESVVSPEDFRILFVDDNTIVKQTLLDTLTSFAFPVSTAASAEQAYSILKNTNNNERAQAINLVIVDQSLSDTTGLDAANGIKNVMQLQVQPLILLLTTYGQEAKLSSRDKNNLDGCLIKPTTPSSLFNAIYEMLHKSDKKQVKTISTSQRFSGKVLLVEDNSLNQQVGKELLENLGLIVVIAESGEAAIQQVQEIAFDLVFMDIQMPGIDGFETTRRIRKNLQNAHLPIIAMTAHAMAGDKEQCLEVGMSDYISKPIDPDVLSRSVQYWIKTNSTSISTDDNQAINDTVNWDVDPEGINLQLGLSRVANNADLYLDLLQEFIEKYGNTVSTLHQYLASDSLENAGRLMHTLGGIAGTIGAVELQNNILDMTNLLQKNNAIEEKILADFNTNFNELTHNLKMWLGEKNTSATESINHKVIHDIELDTEILTRITELLEEGKPEGNKLLARIDIKALDQENAELVSLALRYAQNYDFSNTLANLSKLKI